MIGCHLSIAGGLHHALIEAQHFGMGCVQIFTANQRQWRSKPLSAETLRLWQKYRASTGLAEVVSHDSYLVNLAGPEGEFRQKSLETYREELLRCEALGIRYVATHPGAHLGQGEEQGLRNIAAALDEIHRDLPGLKVATALEITAGQGSNLGWQLEQLRMIIDLVREPEGLAVCLDTAHMLAAGYDLTSRAGVDETLQQVDDIIGLSQVHIIHMNDSKAKRGSRVDRHENIGFGHIPLEVFERLVNHPSLANVPKVLETPKDVAPDGRTWDEVNFETLRRLQRPSPQITQKKRR